MSSHRLSVSGERSYQLTAGGGPYSSLQYPSRSEDAASVSLSGFEEIEVVIGSNARIEHRVYTDDRGTWVYDVLVLEQSLTGYARPAKDGSSHPSTNIDVRRDTTEPGHPAVNPVALSRELVSSAVTETFAGIQYRPGKPVQMTESALINALYDRSDAASEAMRPAVLAVGDEATEILAHRLITATTSPETPPVDGLKPGDYSKFAGLPIEVDADLGPGGWELRPPIPA